MKKQQALETAYICGLRTVGEAYDNVCLHAPNLFKYSEIEAQLNELADELDASGIEDSELVGELLGAERCRELDEEMKELNS